MGDDTWEKWGLLVIDSVDKTSARIEKLEGAMTLIHDDMIELKMKFRIIWGLIGTLLGSLMTLIVLILAGLVQ
jgi:hypothetical protein